MGHFDHDGKGNLHTLYAEGFLNGPGQPFCIRHGVFQRWLTELQHGAAIAVDEMNAAFFQLVLAVFKNNDFLGAG